MITQAIKRWLYKLFAWWPWKSAPATGYSQALTNANMGTAQETMWRTTMEGPLPQAGMMSVAVEQEKDDFMPDPGWLSPEDLPERPVQPSSPTAAEHNNLTHLSPVDNTSISTGDASPPTPTFEQQLAFLQYLVKRGQINEGFSEGQVPKQYTRKYERET